jgi:hypothetical protein
MTAPSVTLSALTKLGFALESTWGTAVAASKVLPIRNLKAPPANYKTELDDGVRGIAAKDFGSYQGVGSADVEWEGDFYPEELGYFLKLIMGSASVTGGSAPYTNSFALGSSPGSLTLEESVLARKWPGMSLSDFGLKFSAAEGKLTYTAKMTGQPSSAVSFAAISDATLAPFLGWEASLNVAGSPYVNLLDLSLDFKRPVELIWSAVNSQSPGAAAAGPLEVTGKATLSYDTTALGYYLANTQNTVVFTLSRGASAALKQLILTFTKMSWADSPVELDRGKNYVTESHSLRGLYNVTDAGPCAIQLKNATNGYAA